MSRKASEFQYKAMSLAYRGKEVFKPLGTGWIDERVACVREYIANVFFYVKGDDVLMVDAGYNYDRLAEPVHGASRGARAHAGRFVPARREEVAPNESGLVALTHASGNSQYKRAFTVGMRL